ncbi:MAG TPA: hypothetical protein ENL20_12355 [Candidatus Cloacimonetes bacterium]|nr:hypothetical protein [Candidatus Cloacimonadota bacterium]
MRKAVFLFFIIILLLGCTSKGDVKFINRTGHLLYFTMQGDDHILAGASDAQINQGTGPIKTISVNIGKKFLFFGAGEKTIDLHLEGETFMMQEADIDGTPTGSYFTDTEINVKANETLNIFADPTHASVKLINDSDKNIVEFRYTNNDIDYFSVIENTLTIGDSVYTQLIASTGQNPLTYTFKFKFEGESDLVEIPGIASLFVDTQALIYAGYYE